MNLGAPVGYEIPLKINAGQCVWKPIVPIFSNQKKTKLVGAGSSTLCNN